MATVEQLKSRCDEIIDDIGRFVRRLRETEARRPATATSRLMESAGPLARLAESETDQRYREAAHRIVYGEPEPAGSRTFDRLFGSGEHPWSFTTSPAPATQPSYAYSDRLHESTAAQRPDPAMDHLFCSSERQQEAAPAGNPELAHLFGS